jgi:hypothetical protein
MCRAEFLSKTPTRTERGLAAPGIRRFGRRAAPFEIRGEVVWQIARESPASLWRWVVDRTCVNVLAWYDNEIGYVNRMIELAQRVGASRKSSF